MTAPTNRNVTRPRSEPTTKQVLEEMVVNRCYVVADLVAAFEDDYDPSRWTIQNRLDELVEEDKIIRREHANSRVTYRRPE